MSRKTIVETLAGMKVGEMKHAKTDIGPITLRKGIKKQVPLYQEGKKRARVIFDPSRVKNEYERP